MNPFACKVKLDCETETLAIEISTIVLHIDVRPEIEYYNIHFK